MPERAAPVHATQSSRLAGRFGILLEHRYGPFLFGLLAALLALPARWAGPFADDFLHRAILLRRGEWSQVSPLDLFALSRADSTTNLFDPGVAWWTELDFHLHLARPLAALTHVLDYALWPDRWGLQHVHSLAWFALGVGLVASLYRSVYASAQVGGLAALLFAVDDSHYLAAGWLASRNALLALACGALMLLQHLAWRRTNRPRHLVLAMLLFIAGLACSEAMLGACAYVVAWQICESGAWARRLLPSVPYALVAVSWWLVYSTLGFGAHGISAYIDPGSQPASFLAALVERVPLFLSAQLLQMPVDLRIALTRPGQIVVSAATGVAVIGLALCFLRLLERDRIARFWALGMTLSLVPICGTIPNDRLLVFVGIGGFGLVASFVAHAGVCHFPPGVRGSGMRWLAVFLLVLHGPVAATLLPLRVASLKSAGAYLSAGPRHIPRGEALSRQTLVFVTGNDFLAGYFQIIRTALGDAPVPRRMAVLASLASTNEIRRSDERTLVITSRDGFLRFAFDTWLMRPGRQFRAGERIDRPDYEVEVLSVTADDRPLSVAFRFHVELEDPSLSWITYRNGSPVPFSLPKPGQAVIEPPGL